MQQQTKNVFKTPEGIYRVDLNITKHAVNKGMRPQYTASRSRLMPTKIDLIDNLNTSTTSSESESPSQEGSSNGSNGSSSSNRAKFDPYGVFLSFNTNDNKVYCYNLMNMRNEKDFGEPIDRLSCDTLPTCHKIHANDLLRRKLNILIGFASGDVAIHSAITKKNLIFHKSCTGEKSGVTCVAWSPSNSDEFLAAYASGNLYLYNRRFSEQVLLTSTDKEQGKGSLASERDFCVVQAKSGNSNPVLKFQISNSTIQDVKYSPSGGHIAVATSDGCLRVIDVQANKLRVVFKSYYGGLTCCCWSPDGRYIVAGGEDDMISVFDFRSRTLLARGIGHSSFISAVIFDPYECNSDQYRFLSVGEDCKLILWNIDKVDNELAQTCDQEDVTTVVENQPLSEVPTFEPVRIHRAHHEPIRDVTVFEMGIVTVCNRNVVKFWVRPKAVEEEDVDDMSMQSEPQQQQSQQHLDDMDVCK